MTIRLLLASAVLTCTAQVQAGEVATTTPDSWQGPYVGVTAGYAWSDFTASVDPMFKVDGELNQRAHGWTAGLAAGYNLQRQDWVFGAELNASVADVKGSANNTLSFSLPGTNGGAPFKIDQVQSSKLKNLFSARLRVGRQFGKVLAYAAGGVAGAHAETDFSVRSAFGNFDSDDKKFHTGYTIGAGLEYRLSRRVSARVEYAYFDLGKQKHQGVPFDFNQQLVRGGVSYHFGG